MVSTSASGPLRGSVKIHVEGSYEGSVTPVRQGGDHQPGGGWGLIVVVVLVVVMMVVLVLGGCP